MPPPSVIERLDNLETRMDFLEKRVEELILALQKCQDDPTHKKQHQQITEHT